MRRCFNIGKPLEYWDVAIIKQAFRIMRRGYNIGKPLK